MNILGLMSGSSLDGLDMALCSFDGIPGKENFSWSIIDTRQCDFPQELVEGLKNCTDLSSKDLCSLNSKFGVYLAEQCNLFISESDHKVDFIASHGHTVFHFPNDLYTLQLGNGAILSQLTKTDVICDFRSSDIAVGGSGAPFAPIVDYYIFDEADMCLNLGGISNISLKNKNGIRAFDVSPCNQILNHLAEKVNLAYDKDGELASQGEIDIEILKLLKKANAFQESSPRAIDNSWVVQNFFPILNTDRCLLQNLMRTSVEFIVDAIVDSVVINDPNQGKYRILVTGGGAFNVFLMKKLGLKLESKNIEILETSSLIINYKEALLMAFMGYLRMRRIPNALKSVTGAMEDTIGGCIYIYK